MVWTISETSRLMIEGSPWHPGARGQGQQHIAVWKAIPPRRACPPRGSTSHWDPAEEYHHCQEEGENLKVYEPGRHAKWTSQGEMPPRGRTVAEPGYAQSIQPRVMEKSSQVSAVECSFRQGRGKQRTLSLFFFYFTKTFPFTVCTHPSVCFWGQRRMLTSPWEQNGKCVLLSRPWAGQEPPGPPQRPI